ncbi:syntaxin-8 [Scaptodrosophila lebanonensis]|uniref:Syntaxin-8 n=1 Tax=Drosophila lebanonensis TaxID=7225 RepID=A0A6J2TZ25_DROLE|nr:syntaxin-8 [Scaptodrosophila lebanonensis]
MALVDHDSFEIEYEGCERMLHQVRTQLHNRQQIREPTLPAYKQLSLSIHSGLDQLRKDVAHLQVVQDNAITWETSTPDELERRRRVLAKLSSQLQEAVEKFKGTSNAAGSFWDNEGPSSSADIPTDVKTLKQRQAEMMKQQDNSLEVLSATISRQREIATRLGNEVEDQNTILDNLANSMDRVDTRVQVETRSLSQVNRRDGTCGYWIVIIALFLAILVVVLI